MDAMDSPSIVDEFQDGWGFLGQSAWNRVMKAIEVGIVGFFRQSTMRQAKLHVGSQQVQEEQLVHLEPFGVTREDVRVILAYGESGRAGVVRKRFEELRRLVEAGQVGLVVLAKHDRLSRNSDDADALYRAMRDHGTLVMVDGRIYDPNDAGDDFVLTMYAKFAEWENSVHERCTEHTATWRGLSLNPAARAGAGRGSGYRRTPGSSGALTTPFPPTSLRPNTAGSVRSCRAPGVGG